MTQVNGVALRPDGTAYANAVFTFVRSPAIVVSQDGSVVTPPERIATLPAEVRTATVEAQSRTASTIRETRTVAIAASPRVAILGPLNRIVIAQKDTGT